MKMHAYGQNAYGAWVPMRVDDDGTQTSPIAPAWFYAAASGGITDTADVTLAAAVTGKVNYLTTLQIVNKHATTSTEVQVKDGATVIWRGYAAAGGQVQTHWFENPLRTTASNALKFACATTSTATMVNAQGYVTASTDQIAALITEQFEEIFDDLGVQVLDDSSNNLVM